jgi:hypothetical protein
MPPRLETLRRLVSLYAAVEEMHSTELHRTTTAVQEAQQAVAAAQLVMQSARVDGRGALLDGDSVGWVMAETRQETAALRRQSLDGIRVEREELSDAARERYVASRLKKEQMKRVFDDIAARMEIEEGRRMQASSDDRFLARRRWTDAQEKLRDDGQIKDF